MQFLGKVLVCLEIVDIFITLQTSLGFYMKKKTVKGKKDEGKQ